MERQEDTEVHTHAYKLLEKRTILKSETRELRGKLMTILIQGIIEEPMNEIIKFIEIG